MPKIIPKKPLRKGEGLKNHQKFAKPGFLGQLTTNETAGHLSHLPPMAVPCSRWPVPLGRSSPLLSAALALEKTLLWLWVLWRGSLELFFFIFLWCFFFWTLTDEDDKTFFQPGFSAPQNPVPVDLSFYTVHGAFYLLELPGLSTLWILQFENKTCKQSSSIITQWECYTTTSTAHFVFPNTSEHLSQPLCPPCHNMTRHAIKPHKKGKPPTQAVAASASSMMVFSYSSFSFFRASINWPNWMEIWLGRFGFDKQLVSKQSKTKKSIACWQYRTTREVEEVCLWAFTSCFLFLDFGNPNKNRTLGILKYQNHLVAAIPKSPAHPTCRNFSSSCSWVAWTLKHTLKKGTTGTVYPTRQVTLNS